MSGGQPRTFSEMRATGVLWAINRVLFHPRGYALALSFPDGVNSEPDGWELLGDGSERWAFDYDDERTDFEHFEALLASLKAAATIERPTP